MDFNSIKASLNRVLGRLSIISDEAFDLLNTQLMRYWARFLLWSGTAADDLIVSKFFQCFWIGHSTKRPQLKKYVAALLVHGFRDLFPCLDLFGVPDAWDVWVARRAW
jgi:hypothetical protein